MKKRLRSRFFDIDFAKREVVLHNSDAKSLGVRTGSHVRCFANRKSAAALVNTTSKFVPRGTVGIFDEIKNALGIKKGAPILIEPMGRPESVGYIKRKLLGEKLAPEEIRHIVDEIVSGNLSDIEISAWVCALHAGGMDMDEVVTLTTAMYSTGDVLDFGEKVFDKHSIGGVPGNKISLLVVPIVAAAGLKIPKTSSRAITSPAGTADTMETFCPVDISVERIKEVVEKTGGCLVWGGSVSLAPADDLMIRAEYPLDLDPRPLLLASVMSKKKAVGADFVVIDIPVGPGTKVANVREGELLAKDFMKLGARIGVKVECAITYGAQPVGHAIGANLEAREALDALKTGKGPESLISKATSITGMLLEAGGVAPPGDGTAKALEILESGDAYRKFVEIVEAQGGKVDAKKLKPGKYSYTIRATESGYVSRVDNLLIKKTACLAGCPKDKEAGIMLHRKVGTKASKGSNLLTIYSRNERKLNAAKKFALANKPIKIEGMVLERVHGPIRIQ